MSGEIIISKERFVDVWDDIQDLIRQHWEEINAHPDVPLDPDYNVYIALEQAGKLHCSVARTESGQIVGYTCWIVSPNLHYRSTIYAQQDVVFLHPDYRRGMVGMRMIKHSEDMLAALGVGVIVHHAKVAHPALGKVLERMGYRATDILYSRRTGV